MRILYSESQKNSPIFAIGVFLPGILIVSGVFGYGIYKQIGLGIPWGDKPMSDEALVILPLALLFFMIGFSVLIRNIRFDTEVTEEGIRIRYKPFYPKWRFFSKSDIVSWEIRHYDALKEYGGHGVKKKRKSDSYTISGKIGLQLNLSDGHTFLIGTLRPEALKLAMQRLKPTH